MEREEGKGMEVGVAINLYFPETGVDRGITALAEGASRFAEQNNTTESSLLIGPSSLDRNSVISTHGADFLYLRKPPPTSSTFLHPRIFIDNINIQRLTRLPYPFRLT